MATRQSCWAISMVAFQTRGFQQLEVVDIGAQLEILSEHYPLSGTQKILGGPQRTHRNASWGHQHLHLCHTVWIRGSNNLVNNQKAQPKGCSPLSPICPSPHSTPEMKRTQNKTNVRKGDEGRQRKEEWPLCGEGKICSLLPFQVQWLKP